MARLRPLVPTAASVTPGTLQAAPLQRRPKARADPNRVIGLARGSQSNSLAPNEPMLHPTDAAIYAPVKKPPQRGRPFGGKRR
jgi:hypothetical protein